VSSLAFSPVGNELGSGSWDKTIRLWNGAPGRCIAAHSFRGRLTIAFRPDAKELAAATLDGSIAFLDVALGKQTNRIERRHAGDFRTAANSSSGKSFNAYLLAGGNSKYVALYDGRKGAVLKKFQISRNLSLDGTEEFLDSRRVTEAGNTDLIDDREYLEALVMSFQLNEPSPIARTFEAIPLAEVRLVARECRSCTSSGYSSSLRNIRRRARIWNLV